jgi:formate--tetrahydrofolate ligase
VPITVAINNYVTDSEAEHLAIKNYCKEFDVECVVSSHWEHGGDGATELAEQVIDLVDNHKAQFRPLYKDDLPLWDKVRRIARSIYGAEDILADKKVREQFVQFQDQGYGHYPICMAKTQYSFSTDPQLLGAPSGHDVQIRELRLATGAEFLIVICGAIMTMPGLPRLPAAEQISVTEDGRITGLF